MLGGPENAACTSCDTVATKVVIERIHSSGSLVKLVELVVLPRSSVLGATLLAVVVPNSGALGA
jgi:hypothetical protein